MIILYSLIAIFIAWIWVDYFRLIDIYEKESLVYFIITFILGGASVYIVFGLSDLIDSIYVFELNGDFLNDFLYSTFHIGAIEEFAKLIPFVIVYYLFRDQFNEPIDYLVFICISALGFSAVENEMYFYRHGPYIINGRAILSTVEHMFDTALIAYGIILYKFFSRKLSILVIFLFFFLASLSHGFYDFWLIYEDTSQWGIAITVLYFLITISLFAVILNNAINNSSFFTYKKVIDSNKVMWRLLSYYGVVFLIQFIFMLFLHGIDYALIDFLGSLLTTGFIVFITSVRLSRFKLIKDRWHKLKIELPFSIHSGDSYAISGTLLSVRIKGDPFNEAYISTFFKEYFHLKPLSLSSTKYLGKPRISYIEEKLFLKNDRTCFIAKIFHDTESGEYDRVLLKPKVNGVTMQNELHPIVAILKIDRSEDINSDNFNSKKLKFLEWGVIKPK